MTTEALWRRLSELRREQLRYLPAEEARAYGFDLEPGWVVKIDWVEDVPKYTYVSPEKWEYSDLVYGAEGEIEEYTALTPEGETYTKAELEVLEKEYQVSEAEYQAILTSLEPFKTPEGLYDVTEAMKVIPRETLIRVFAPEDLAQPVAEAASYQLKAQDMQGLLARVYPERAGETLETIQNWASENTEAFIEDLRSKGKSPDTEALLRTLLERSVHTLTGEPFTAL